MLLLLEELLCEELSDGVLLEPLSDELPVPWLFGSLSTLLGVPELLEELLCEELSEGVLLTLLSDELSPLPWLGVLLLSSLGVSELKASELGVTIISEDVVEDSEEDEDSSSFAAK